MHVGLLPGACLESIRGNQNADGGWGYHPQSQSRVEPTCWAYLALSAASDARDFSVLLNARQFLLANQDKSGFWTASPEMKSGNWVTSLACSVLAHELDAISAMQSGLAWLCKDLPLDSSPWLRILRKLQSRASHSEHDESLRDWGWTPRTSSWVEPTSFALLALQEFQRSRWPAAAPRRCELAVALLYDRMCPSGGWNCGDPRVYGVVGEPMILPTAWALIALRAFPEHKSKTLSLAWLESAVHRVQSPGSLAVAIMCLEAYGKRAPNLAISLTDYTVESLLADGIHALAWVCLALNSNRNWPARVGAPI
jgi:hypothetical protein